MSEDILTSARPQAATDQPVSELPDPGAGQASLGGEAADLDLSPGASEYPSSEERPIPEGDTSPPSNGAASSPSLSGVRTCLHTQHIIDKTLKSGDVVFVCADCDVELDLAGRP